MKASAGLMLPPALPLGKSRTKCGEARLKASLTASQEALRVQARDALIPATPAHLGRLLHGLAVIPRRTAVPLLPPRPVAFPDTSLGLRQVWSNLGATLMECGATTRGASGEQVSNQCFYLSLAAATCPPGEDHHSAHLDIRHRIEAAVREARPGWQVADLLGHEVGAFADFLIWGLQACPRLQGHAVALYNSVEGTCEVFRPPGLAVARRSVRAICYTPGHYLWVRWGRTGGAPSLTALLARHQVGPRDTPSVPTIITHTAGGS